MEYTLRDLQLSILEIMKEFKRICEKHNLKYILMGGTCLGAIRHNGFIPWDDDADFAMPREDYDKFKKICKQNELSNEYVLQDYDKKKEPHYTDGWIRLRKKNTLCVIDYHKKGGYNELGVFVDIFPFDYVKCNNKSKLMRLQKKYTLYSKLFKNKVSKNRPTIKSKILHLLILPLPTKSIYSKRENLCKKYNHNNANYIADFNSKYGIKKAIFDIDTCEKTIDYDFEGTMFKIPQNYDDMLKVAFGVYMKLPPKEEQVGHMPKEIKL